LLSLQTLFKRRDLLLNKSLSGRVFLSGIGRLFDLKVDRVDQAGECETGKKSVQRAKHVAEDTGGFGAAHHAPKNKTVRRLDKNDTGDSNQDKLRSLHRSKSRHRAFFGPCSSCRERIHAAAMRDRTCTAFPPERYTVLMAVACARERTGCNRSLCMSRQSCRGSGPG
jgi:hypothetical protein